MTKKKWCIWKHKAEEMGWKLTKVKNLYIFSKDKVNFEMSLLEMKKCLRGNS